MLERFTKDAKAIVRCAENEARDAGSPSVEAEHLLLALTWPVGGPARGALADAGLDREAVAVALELEQVRALAAVGVAMPDLPPPARRTGRVRFGASARLALERALPVAVARGDRRLGPEHVLLGLLRAEGGVVHRALDAAGIDRDQLTAAL